MDKKQDPRVRVHPRESEGRPLQYSDLDKQGRALAEAGYSAIGSELASRVNTALNIARTAASNPNNSDVHRKKSQNDVRTLEEMQRLGTVDRPMTIKSAARARVKRVDAAVRRVGTPDAVLRPNPSTSPTMAGIPAGVGWYFDHADEIDRAARAHGYDTETAINASGAMSPQNGPEREKEAVTALMKGGRHNAPVTAITDRGASAIDVSGPGSSRQFNDLTDRQLRAISNTKMAEHVDSPVSLKALGNGGTELTTGRKVLTGELPAHEIGKNASKVTSYIEAAQNAHRADANVRSEYFRRAHEAFTDSPYFEQPTVFGPEWEKDPWGKANSTEGILNPRGNTAEDTWMRSISLDLPNGGAVLELGKNSGRLGKAAASNATIQAVSAKDVYPTPVGAKKTNGEEVHHAMDNAATIAAARTFSDRRRRQGRNMGAGIPAVMMQETAWTEERAALGKDDLHERVKKQQSALPSGRSEIKGQQSLY